MTLTDFFFYRGSTFACYFAMPIAKSAPHVYLSALPFVPSCSLISVHYFGLFPWILCLKCGQLSHWPSDKMVISNVEAIVYSVSLSSDDEHIISVLKMQQGLLWHTQNRIERLYWHSQNNITDLCTWHTQNRIERWGAKVYTRDFKYYAKNERLHMKYTST